MSNNIEGKVVVITGASSGLGEASARYLSTQGATVVLGARRHDRIESLARELTARGGKATAVTTNVTDRQQVKKLVDAAVQAYGRIDVIGFVTLPNRTRSNSAGTSGVTPRRRLRAMSASPRPERLGGRGGWSGRNGERGAELAGLCRGGALPRYGL
jgi:NADPH:quinone reductase-like Zn-dependent oxidoreductase